MPDTLPSALPALSLLTLTATCAVGTTVDRSENARSSAGTQGSLSPESPFSHPNPAARALPGSVCSTTDLTAFSNAKALGRQRDEENRGNCGARAEM